MKNKPSDKLIERSIKMLLEVSIDIKVDDIIELSDEGFDKFKSDMKEVRTLYMENIVNHEEDDMLSLNVIQSKIDLAQVQRDRRDELDQAATENNYE